MATQEEIERVRRMLAALEKLPPTSGLTFRGIPSGEQTLAGATVTSGVTATSRDPRVATENFAHDRLYAIVVRTARDVGPFGAHPEEAELVLLPGTVLAPLGRIRLEDAGTTVEVVEEIDLAGPPPAGPEGGLDALVRDIAGRVTAARRAGAIQVWSPGKFAGEIF